MSPDQQFEVRESVPLGPLTTLGLGGPARWFATATTPGHVAAAYTWCRERDIPLSVIGGGSNLVIAEGGIRSLVLQMGIRGMSFDPLPDGRTRVAAGAGEPWDDFVAAVVARGLAGVECLSGIPGTVGGTPIQNVGAYGQEVADTLESVAVFDIASGEERTVAAADCRFTYRMSRFKAEPGRYIVTAVTFTLQAGQPTVHYPDLRARIEQAGIGTPSLADVRRAVIDVRRTKGMVLDPADPDSRSVGSFFMNPIVRASSVEAMARAAGTTPPTFAVGGDGVKIPAAWLIERAGFSRGYGDGPVGISSKHPLALVNRGGATARDVLKLAMQIKRRVADRFGVWLKPEPIFVGLDDDPAARYLLQDGTE